MNLGHLLAPLLELAAAAGLPETLRSPGAAARFIAVLLFFAVGLSAVFALVRLFVIVIKKLKLASIEAALDAVTRYTHTRGRNRARDLLCASIAKDGKPEEKLAALREINRVSPLDAPGAGFLDERLPGPALPSPRQPRETTIVMPQPAGGRHRAREHELS